MTQGNQVRDFISVQNTVELLLRDIAESRIDISYPVVKHVATGIPQRTIDFVKYWWKEWEASGTIIAGALPYRDKEMMRIISSRNSIF
jgi:hypothetical protein